MNRHNGRTKRQQGSRGFTVVELIIVIAVLGILAAIAVPNLSSVRNNAQTTVDRTNAKLLVNSVNSFNILYGASDNAIVTVEQISREFMQELWPEGMTREDGERALHYITIQNGVAKVVD